MYEFNKDRLPEVVMFNDCKFLAEGPHWKMYGGLDKWGNLHLHHKFEDPLLHVRQFKKDFAEVCRVLRDVYGLDAVYTVADNATNFRFNKLFGFKSALVAYELDNGAIWEIMVCPLSQ